MMVVFEGVKVALARMLLRICSHFHLFGGGELCIDEPSS